MRLRGPSGDTSSGVGSYSTTFPATENPISENGAWNRGASEGLDWTDPQTTGGSPGVAWPTMPIFDGTNYNDSIACLKNWATTNYTITATMFNDGTYNTSSGNTYETELFLRQSISAHSAPGYEVDAYMGGNKAVLVRWNGAHNSFNIMDNSSSVPSTAFNDGSVWVAKISGSIITLTIDGTAISWVTAGSTNFDAQAWANTNGGSYYANGAPGMGFWNEKEATAMKRLGWKSWSVTSP